MPKGVSTLTAYHLKTYKNRFCKLCGFEATDPRDRVPHLIDVHHIFWACAINSVDGLYKLKRWYFTKYKKQEEFAVSSKTVRYFGSTHDRDAFLQGNPRNTEYKDGLEW